MTEEAATEYDYGGPECEYCGALAINGIDKILYCRDHKLDAETAAEVRRLAEAQWKLRHFEIEAGQTEYQLRRSGHVIRLSDRELGLVTNCLTYASNEPAGLPGHKLMLIVAKLASALGELDIDGRNAEVPGPGRAETAVPTQDEGGWIAASDRLPKKREPVIGFDCFYGRVGEAVLSTWSDNLEFINSDDCYITHWQPFPYPTEDMATCPEDEEE